MLSNYGDFRAANIGLTPFGFRRIVYDISIRTERLNF